MSETTTQSVASHPLGEKLLAALDKVADGILTVRVNTVIGTISLSTVSTQDENITVNIATQVQEAASTAVNMLDGDCNAVFSKGFLDTPAYVELHKQSVADARAIRADTMALIERAVETVQKLVTA